MSTDQHGGLTEMVRPQIEKQRTEIERNGSTFSSVVYLPPCFPKGMEEGLYGRDDGSARGDIIALV